jgi:hypothetical protein
LFLVSCSETKKEDSPKKNEADVKSVVKPEPNGFCANLTKNQKLKTIPVQTVHWMYLDDSLINICRPLNFQLPWMGSDIMVLPDKITPEILRLSPIKTFEILGQGKEVVNDSIFIFHYSLKKDDCHCHVNRYYKGNANDKKFDGFLITEQIICNAKSNERDFLETNLVKKEEDYSKNEMHGHEH